MSQSNDSKNNPSNRFRGNTIIIAALVAIAGYVALGYGPFGAAAYDSKGAPIQVQHFGGSSDYRFANF